MSSEDTKILEFNQNQKSDKSLFIIYADHECIIEYIDGCKNSPENSSGKKTKRTYSIRLCLYHLPMSIISSFRSIESKHDVNRGKDCMK